MNAAHTPAGSAHAWPRSRHGVALAVLGVVVLLWAVALAVALASAVLPDEADGTVAVVFAPGTGEGRMLDTILDAGGALARDTQLRNVWIVYDDEPGFAGRLREGGAWQVFVPIAFGMVALPGCVPGLVVSEDARQSDG